MGKCDCSAQQKSHECRTNKVKKGADKKHEGCLGQRHLFIDHSKPEVHHVAGGKLGVVQHYGVEADKEHQPKDWLAHAWNDMIELLAERHGESCSKGEINASENAADRV
ncbi:hypothetical protein V2E39_24365, partial [Chryseobacterium arthrosphaerae]